MSSSDTSQFNALHGAHRKSPKPAKASDSRQRRFSVNRRTIISRGNAVLLLRYTLRLFVICSALYALYTFGLYLLFRDRLFYSLFVARSLML